MNLATLLRHLRSAWIVLTMASLVIHAPATAKAQARPLVIPLPYDANVGYCKGTWSGNPYWDIYSNRINRVEATAKATGSVKVDLNYTSGNNRNGVKPFLAFRNRAGKEVSRIALFHPPNSVGCGLPSDTCDVKLDKKHRFLSNRWTKINKGEWDLVLVVTE